MNQTKLTKNALRDAQEKLVQLERYLPTLKLKKSLLQGEIEQQKSTLEAYEKSFQKEYQSVLACGGLMTIALPIAVHRMIHVVDEERDYRNVAGLELPYLRTVHFSECGLEQQRYLSGEWSVLHKALRQYHTAQLHVAYAKKRLAAVEAELRTVSIRVNLFEKRLIPQCVEDIARVKNFLRDQELVAIGRSKLVKSKKNQLCKHH